MPVVAYLKHGLYIFHGHTDWNWKFSLSWDRMSFDPEVIMILNAVIMISNYLNFLFIKFVYCYLFKQEAILMLERYTKDFRQLIEWLRIKYEYENTSPPLRPHSLSWEIRASSHSKVGSVCQCRVSAVSCVCSVVCLQCRVSAVSCVCSVVCLQCRVSTVSCVCSVVFL